MNAIISGFTQLSSVISSDRDQSKILTMYKAPDPKHEKDGDPSAYSWLLKPPAPRCNIEDS